MVKHTQTTPQTICLCMFDHFVGFTLKGLLMERWKSPKIGHPVEGRMNGTASQSFSPKNLIIQSAVRGSWKLILLPI